MFLTREIAQYVEYLKARGYSSETVKSYRHNLKIFEKYLKEGEFTELNEINREVVFRYQMYLTNHQPVISLFMQRSCLLVVKSFTRYLVKAGRMLFNPASEIELPRLRKKLPKGILSVKEVKRLLKQPDVKTVLGIRDRAILEVLYSGGMRNKELRGLKINDVDLKEGTLRIDDGKGGKDRIIPLGKKAGEYLEQYLQTARGKLTGHSGDQIVFMGRKKRGLSSEAVSDMVGKYARQAGFKNPVTPHTLRHTCATHMLKNRAGLRHIQVLLGHKCLETTQKYTQVEISDLKRVHAKYHPRENQT